MDTDGVYGNESGVEKGRHDGIKDVGNEHNPLGQEEEHREDGNDNIVVCDADHLFRQSRHQRD